MMFMETSTVTNVRVQNAFQDLLQEIYARRQVNPQSFQRGALKISKYEPPQQDASWCAGCGQ